MHFKCEVFERWFILILKSEFCLPKLAKSQHERIKAAIPTQRGNDWLSNLKLLNAILYTVENGCNWRDLP